jgi:hypothetical protein
MTSPDDKIKAAASEGFNLLHLVFTGLALLCFLAGIGVLLYDVSGLLRGTGWHMSQLADLMDWLWAPPPATPQSASIWQLLGLVLLAPATLSLMALGWLFSKIGNGFERLS